jgi:hypothetical protein
MAKIQFEGLEKAAAKVSGKKVVSAGDAADYFLFSGTDFKGLNQSCYSAFGAKLSSEITVDPLKLHSLGVFSLEITVAADVSVLKKTLLICQIGPKNQLKYGATRISVLAPKMLNFCTGVQCRASITPSLFVGISYSSNDITTPLPLGLEANLKVGATAKVGVSGDYFYAENRLPLPFSDNPKLRETLKSLLESDSIKAFIKQPAVQLINDNSWAGNDVLQLKKINSFYSTAKGSNIDTDTLVTYLDKGIRSTTNVTLKDQAEAIKRNLLSYKNNIIQPIVTSIRIFAGAVEADVKAEATASVSAKAMGFQLGASSDTVFGHTTAKYKPVYVRFQAVYPAKDMNFSGLSTFRNKLDSPDNNFVVMTQDTSIYYRSWSFQLIDSDNKANIGTSIQKTKKIESKAYGQNQMFYVTTTVYWASKDKVHPYLIDKTSNSMSAHYIQTTSLEGSGISFGASFLLYDLREALQWSYSYLEKVELEPLPLVPETITADDVKLSEALRAKVKIALKDFNDWFDKENTGLYRNIRPHILPKCIKGLQSIVQGGEAYSRQLEQTVNWLLGMEYTDTDTTAPIEANVIERLIAPRSSTTLVNPAVKHPSQETPASNSSTQQLAHRLDEARKSAINDIRSAKSAAGNLNLANRKEYEQKLKVVEPENLRKQFLNQNIEEINQGLDDYMKPKRVYMESVAKQLNVTLDQLYQLFDDPEVKQMIIDYEKSFDVDEGAAILLESGFAWHDKDIKLTSTLVKTRGTFGLKPSGERIELDTDTAKKMKASFEKSKLSERSLNVIRMRFRLQDQAEAESTLFKLGSGSYKLLGNGGNIELKSVSEAGSEGIIDVAVKWYGTANQFGDEQSKYESGVPPVALYCQ